MSDPLQETHHGPDPAAFIASLGAGNPGQLSPEPKEPTWTEQVEKMWGDPGPQEFSGGFAGTPPDYMPPRPALPPCPDAQQDPVGHMIYRMEYYSRETEMAVDFSMAERARTLGVLYCAQELRQANRNADKMLTAVIVLGIGFWCGLLLIAFFVMGK